LASSSGTALLYHLQPLLLHTVFTDDTNKGKIVWVEMDRSRYQGRVSGMHRAGL
jgi:hypothetical protein